MSCGVSPRTHPIDPNPMPIQGEKTHPAPLATTSTREQSPRYRSQVPGRRREDRAARSPAACRWISAVRLVSSRIGDGCLPVNRPLGGRPDSVSSGDRRILAYGNASGSSGGPSEELRGTGTGREPLNARGRWMTAQVRSPASVAPRHDFDIESIAPATAAVPATTTATTTPSATAKAPAPAVFAGLGLIHGESPSIEFAVVEPLNG